MVIESVKKNLTAGINRVKWIASFVAERTKAETSIAKLLYESSKLENRMDDLYRDIGRRVHELREKGEKEGTDFSRDFLIQQTLDEIKNLREAVDDYRKKAKNHSKLPE